MNSTAIKTTMTAIFQALLSSAVLNHAIVSCVQKNPESIKKSPLFLEYAKLVVEYYEKKSSPLPFNLKDKRFDEKNKLFQSLIQHYDPNKILTHTINNFCEIIEKEDNNIFEVIKNICFGKYIEYFICDACNHVPVKQIDFLVTELSIPDKENPILNDCFEEFAALKTLDEENKQTCPKCKINIVTHKKLAIKTVPGVIILSFDRFKNAIKKTTPVRIYSQIYLENKSMDLISTINFYGQPNDGHYVAHVYRNKRWYKMDYSSVQPVSTDDVLNSSTICMAIYQQKTQFNFNNLVQPVDSEIENLKRLIERSFVESSVGPDLQKIYHTLLQKNGELQKSVETLESKLEKSDEENNNCGVCMLKIVQKIVILPCGHTQICETCVNKLDRKKCPFCKSNFVNYTKIY